MASTYALQSAPYNQSNAAYKREARLVLVLTFAAGAPSVSAARSAPGFTIVDGATGAYTGTCPKASRGIILSQVFVPSAADSNMLTITAFSPTAGTFSIQAHANAAPADIPDGGEVWLYFILEGG